MFTRLRLTNFKVWRDTGDVALGPVTLLLGTNSSGKSSLIQSLLLLKQTVLAPDRSVHLSLSGDEATALFDFGSFETVLLQGAGAPRQFSIAFDFERAAATGVSRGSFECHYGQTAARSVAVHDLRLSMDDRQFRAVRREKGAYAIAVDGKTLPGVRGPHYAPERSIAFSAHAVSRLGHDGPVVEDLSLAIRRELEQIRYLGPLRRRPQRDYAWQKAAPGDIGSDGARTADVLMASALLKGNDQGQVVNGVSKWLQRMKVADRLEVRQLGRASRYELVVHRDGLMTNVSDVGIGVALVLPVLAVAYAAPQGSTIILEEPEIHLHPLAQSVLAELFVEVSRERGVQFIVETHSEHLFRRMQTLIARGEVAPDDARMYFVEHDGGNARMRALAVDEFGRVGNWPDGFFGDALGETREQARLMFERRKRGGE